MDNGVVYLLSAEVTWIDPSKIGTANQHGENVEPQKVNKKVSSEQKLDRKSKTCQKKADGELNSHLETNNKSTLQDLQDPNLACEVCDKLFSDQSLLKKHLLSHEDIKRYQCEFCDKSFASQAGFKYHLRTHLGNTPYTCDKCGESFSLKSKLKRHNIALHSDNQKKLYFCHLCDKSFASKGGLGYHLNTHSSHGEKRFSCHICHEGFMNNSHLKKHVWDIHSSGKTVS